MKILALEKDREGIKGKDFQSLLKEEALTVWNLYQKNIIREIYFRADRSNAILILECDSVEQAKDILTQLPLAKNELIDFEVIPLEPYPGFLRLFDEQHSQKM